MNLLAWLIFVMSALMEVSGDATMRHGLRCGRSWMVAVGCVVLSCYGLLVNTVKWDFSKLLGVYVGFFALVSVLFGRFVLGENVPVSTWAGLGIILAGCMVVQFGSK